MTAELRLKLGVCSPPHRVRIDPGEEEGEVKPADLGGRISDPSVDEILKAVEACRVCIENSRQLLRSVPPRKLKLYEQSTNH